MCGPIRMLPQIWGRRQCCLLSPPPTLWTLLIRMRWSKVKNCYTTAIFTHTGGLIRFYIVIWSLLSQFKWPLLFLHHRGRGRGTRLSIRSQDPNNSSDTERGPCLGCTRSVEGGTACYLVLEKVVTDKWTDRNSYLSLYPFCGRVRVKKTFNYILAQLHSSSNMG